MLTKMLPIHNKIKTCLNIPIWPTFWWTKNIYIVQKTHQGRGVTLRQIEFQRVGTTRTFLNIYVNFNFGKIQSCLRRCLGRAHIWKCEYFKIVHIWKLSKCEGSLGLKIVRNLKFVNFGKFFQVRCLFMFVK